MMVTRWTHWTVNATVNVIIAVAARNCRIASGWNHVGDGHDAGNGPMMEETAGAVNGFSCF